MLNGYRPSFRLEAVGQLVGEKRTVWHYYSILEGAQITRTGIPSLSFTAHGVTYTNTSP